MAKIRSDFDGVALLHLDGAEPKYLKAGDEVPDGYTAGPHLLDGSDEPLDDGTPQEPPRSGAGSSKDAWLDYVSKIPGIEVDPKADRDEIIAAVDAFNA